MSPYLWMICGAFAFAVMSTCAHALAPHYDWQIIAGVRAFLALIFAGALGLAAGVKFVVWRPRALWMRSIAGSFSLVCGFFALSRLPVADVLTVTNMYPIWVALLSWPLLDEHPGREVWASVALSVLGVALIQHPHLATGNYAMVMAVVSSFTSAVSMIGLHRLHGVDHRAIVVHFSAVSSLCCLAAWLLLPASEQSTNEIRWDTIPLLLGMGIAATTGQICLTKAFATGDPARVSVVGLTQVGFAMFFDVVQGHTFTPLAVLGIALVVAPTAWLLVHSRDETAETI